MKHSEIFKEAARLYKLGFAIHWLHPNSKRPIELKWASGDRKPWAYLKETYMEGLNVGTRLGTASAISVDGETRYLTVIDVDIKSKTKEHRTEAVAALRKLLGNAGLGPEEIAGCPEVRSGRGNGSRHLYCLTRRSFKTFNPAQSADIVKVQSPSKKPSKKEREALTPQEIADGIRLSHAWEISLYSDGRQVVLPPSIHPDTKKPYLWKTHINSVADLSLADFSELESQAGQDENIPAMGTFGSDGQFQGSVREANLASERSGDATPLNFKVEPVDIGWLPISDAVREGIVEGKDVADRSGFLLKASSALLSAGLNQNEVLTVLTDPDTYLGAVGYEHAQTKDRARAAAWVYRYTLKKVKKERAVEGVFTSIEDAEPEVKLSAEETAEQTKELLEGRHWSQNIDRTKGGLPKPTIWNVILILQNAIGDDIFKRNSFAFRDAYGVETPWGGRVGDVVTDDDVARIKYWLSEHYGFEPSKEAIGDAVTNIACENSFDPVMDGLAALPEWDGTKRLDTWLKKNFEAEGDEEYLAQVFRKWMVAMILRVYEPGAKFDWMPIFEGKQGVGKSSFGRLLCGDKFFLDWLPNLADKDAALALQGMWVIEMGELSQFRKNEMEVIKGFITRTVDKLRPPFGKRWIESPRRCVFFGTTNRDKYLKDETGNRRLKPVMVGALNFKELRKDRAQLFAEAKYLYDQKMETGETLDLSGQAKVFEAKIHADKMVEDDATTMREILHDFVEKEASKDDVVFDLEKFRMVDLFQGIGPLHRWRLDNRNTQFAAKALKMMGGEKWKSDGVVYWKLHVFTEKHQTGYRFEGRPVPLDFY